MAGFGEIYNSTWWGSPCGWANNWAIIYRDIAGCSTDNLIAENNDNLIAENGDNLISQ
ncbi:MAG: hypothetical protein KAS30_01120 [Candidatus Diapherotrites archaeon]|nr:hypothetical protein [Candidatus Diapherotrites archaeon]